MPRPKSHLQTWFQRQALLLEGIFWPCCYHGVFRGSRTELQWLTMPQLGDRMSVRTRNPLPLLVIIRVLMYLQLLNCTARILHLHSSFMLATAVGIERYYKSTEESWIYSIPRGHREKVQQLPDHHTAFANLEGFHSIYLLELIHTFVNSE